MPDTQRHKSRQKLVLDMIVREKPTIRQLLRLLAAAGHQVLIGTPAQVADVMQRWAEAGAADGFNVMFADLGPSITDFVDLVVPELQRRGLFRRDYQGRTLREHLGLARPANRFAAAR
jgi:alkanesulfonate monooxygenase SsuD/methylene tetrahydromethanopterin reductase-like flavin-dependent oxidoreductase (luciferase family)